MTPTAVHNIKSGKTFSVQKSFRYDEIEVVALSRLDDNFVVFKLRRRPDYIFACGHKMEILNIMKGLKIPVDIIFSNTIKFKISTGMTRYLIFAMQETIVDVKIVEDALGVANKSLVGDESD